MLSSKSALTPGPLRDSPNMTADFGAKSEMSVEWEAATAEAALRVGSRARGMSGAGLGVRLGLALRSTPPTLSLQSKEGTVQVELRGDRNDKTILVGPLDWERLEKIREWRCEYRTELLQPWEAVVLRLVRGPLDEEALGGWRVLAGRLRGRELSRIDSLLLDNGVALTVRCGGAIITQERGVVTARTSVRLERWTMEPLVDTDGQGLFARVESGAVAIEGGAGAHESLLKATVRVSAEQEGRISWSVTMAELRREPDLALHLGRHVCVLGGLEGAEEADGFIVARIQRAMAGRMPQGSTVALQPRGALRGVFGAGQQLGNVSGAGQDSAKSLLKPLLETDEALLGEAWRILAKKNGAVAIRGAAGSGKTWAVEQLGEAWVAERRMRGCLSGLVQAYVGESERSLSQLFSRARREGGVVLLDDVDLLLQGSRGLQSVLLAELRQGQCAVVLAARQFPAALVERCQLAVLLPAAPDDTLRKRLLAPLQLGCVGPMPSLTELVNQTAGFSAADCVRLLCLARLASLATGEDASSASSSPEVRCQHVEQALAMLNPFYLTS